MSFIRHRRATSPNKFECRNVYSTNHIDVDSVNAVKMKKSGHTVIELNYSSPKAIGVWKNLNKQIKLYSIDEIVVHHASPILYLFAWGLKLKNSYLKIVAYAHCEAEDMLSGSGKLSIKDKIIVHSFANSDKVSGLIMLWSDIRALYL